ncbi:MAG: exonuclease SbcCD subunit D [Clostridia bacterium]|nr:exonuclease SbcCD subunit D [Clostridia bacterium]
MKFFHLADLHIGKRVNGYSMLEDQRFVLDQVIGAVAEEKPAAVIIAGDVYDRQVPPAEAVSLFDSFITELSGLCPNILMISGNHDSGERLAFGARLIERSGVFISGVYEGQVQRVSISEDGSSLVEFDGVTGAAGGETAAADGTGAAGETAAGMVDFYLLPFVKPAYVRRFFPDVEIRDHNDAVRTVIESLHLNPARRNVLVAHQFVTGASPSDSEEITVGTLENVDGSLFDPFDYVALGHIHGPQQVGRPEVRYAGTPLKYSLSEISHSKSATVVELDEDGRADIRTIPLKPLHDMRTIKGTYMELTERSSYIGTDTDDYMHIILTDEMDVPDAASKLRVIYPNMMKLEYDNTRTSDLQTVEGAVAAEKKTPLQLFGELYKLQNNSPMNDEMTGILEELVKEIWEEEK